MVPFTKTGKSTMMGFTIIELLVVLLLVSLLASIVTPVVTKSINRAKEATLKEDLFLIRKTIDDYYADTGKYPSSLETLVEKKYIRKMPVDPITDSTTTWELAADGEGISDIKSGSTETASDGTQYNEW